MNRNDWTRSFLARGDIPLGPIDPEAGVPVNVLSFIVWIESVASISPNNPLGYDAYETITEGWDATLLALQQPRYAELLKVLMDPITAEETIETIHASSWGSKPTEQMLDNARNHWPAFGGAYISGTVNE